MYRYKRILVNLNMDEGDKNLMRHAFAVAQMAKAEKMYFLYTEKELDIPEELVKAYPQLTESVADFARERIKESIQAIIDEQNMPEIMIIIEEGSILDQVLKQTRINGTDLVIFGISKDRSETLKTAVKLARKAPCSVLIIPEGAEWNLSNPAVALDFSEYSADVMDAATAFARADRGEKLTMFHVYQVPTGYHKTGKSYDKFAEIMKGHARQRFEKLKQEPPENRIQIKESYILNHKPGDAIRDAVKDNNITFLSVGARGANAGITGMLGSVPETLIEKLDIPLLVIKKKGSGVSILNALFN